jgi:excinuclease UvrABC ATPase subunit
VTPELAAQIIKQYVLPMFDSKRNSKSLSGTVYNKIKLTEQIYSELEKVRLKLD